MAKVKEPPQRSFTIYLIDASFQQTAAIVAKPAKEYSIDVDGTHVGTLYIEPRPSTPPAWAQIFLGHVPSDAFGWVSSSSAVLVVEASGRFFAITFGQGRYLLTPGATEDRFGLKVVLNSIPAEKIRSIDKKTFDAIDSNSRVQATQEAEAQDFGIDTEQDLLRAVTGTPTDSSLGKRLSGRDALHVVTKCELSGVRDMLSLYYSKYREEAYKDSFPWVDNIAEIGSSSAVKVQLDAQLAQVLTDMKLNASTQKCWLAVPEIIDWERVAGFRFGGRQDAPIHHDLHLPGFFRSIKDESITPELLARQFACAVDAEGLKIHKWPIYKCLHCEIDLDGRVYVLSAGKWYAITKNLADLVDQFFNALPTYDKSLPDYSDDDEEAYNIRVAGQSDGSLQLMDQKFVRVSGRTNNIEFCDLYGVDKDIIHVKKYGASSVLNHLFAQGLMSGECMRSLEGFVGEVNKILSPSNQLIDGDLPRNVDGYRIVFAVISESKKALALPFFARVSLRQAAKRLQSINFKVLLAKISVVDALSKIEKIPNKPQNKPVKSAQ